MLRDLEGRAFYLHVEREFGFGNGGDGEHGQIAMDEYGGEGGEGSGGN